VGMSLSAFDVSYQTLVGQQLVDHHLDHHYKRLDRSRHAIDKGPPSEAHQKIIRERKKRPGYSETKTTKFLENALKRQFESKLQEVEKRGGLVDSGLGQHQAINYSHMRSKYRKHMMSLPKFKASQAHEVLWSNQEEQQALTMLSTHERVVNLTQGYVNTSLPEEAAKHRHFLKTCKGPQIVDKQPPPHIYLPEYVKDRKSPPPQRDSPWQPGRMTDSTEAAWPRISAGQTNTLGNKTIGAHKGRGSGGGASHTDQDNLAMTAEFTYRAQFSSAEQIPAWWDSRVVGPHSDDTPYGMANGRKSNVWYAFPAEARAMHRRSACLPDTAAFKPSRTYPPPPRRRRSSTSCSVLPPRRGCAEGRAVLQTPDPSACPERERRDPDSSAFEIIGGDSSACEAAASSETLVEPSSETPAEPDDGGVAVSPAQLEHALEDEANCKTPALLDGTNSDTPALLDGTNSDTPALLDGTNSDMEGPSPELQAN